MDETRITVRDNASLKVEGPFTLIDADGNPFAVEAGKAVLLCRCGQSADKPFCDASHRAAGFQSAPRAKPQEAPAG